MKQRCPGCNEPILGHAVPGRRATAKAGDISMCWTCAAVCRYGDDMVIRQMTDADIKALAPETQRGIAEWIAFRQRARSKETSQ